MKRVVVVDLGEGGKQEGPSCLPRGKGCVVVPMEEWHRGFTMA